MTLLTAIPVIAIDGPSASGKGTVAARVAAALGFYYLDSGALYRVTALRCQQLAIDWNDEAAVTAVAQTLDVAFIDGQVMLAGQDVSDALRGEVIGQGASIVAALPAVRTALLARQRAFAQSPGLVTDGRDMGSVVFPAAGLKIFLTASAQVRAERRYKQLIAKGETVNIDRIRRDIEQRDERDSTRSVAPLCQLPDALLLETSLLSIEQAVSQVLAWHAAVQSKVQ